MSQNSPPADLRVRRTRKLLRDALVDLIEEQGVAALTHDCMLVGHEPAGYNEMFPGVQLCTETAANDWGSIRHMQRRCMCLK